MKISELIAKLQEVKDKEGDLNVCVSEKHEYWGSVQRHIQDYDMNICNHAQPDGPKLGKSEKAVVFEY